MRAICMERFGEPDVLVERELPVPEPGIGEVLVRVHATSVNPLDATLRRTPGFGIEPPAVLGADVSGEVVALGPGVAHLAVGDEVFYTPEIGLGRQGTYAEYHAAPADLVHRKPRNLDHARAAAVPFAGSAAWQALVECAGLRPGETVLVHGGAGGVGSFAIQIARAAGCRVITTCSRSNVFLVRHVGADRAIDYRKEDLVEVIRREVEGGVHVALDTQGGEVLERTLRVMAPGGRVVSLRAAGPVDLAAAQARGVTVHAFRLHRRRATLEALVRLVEQGHIEPVAADVRDVTEVRGAHRDIERGHGRHGKIVLRVA